MLRHPERFCVLLTGSRRASWPQLDVVAERLDRYPDGTTILHGDGDGVDTVAEYSGPPSRHSVPVPYFSDMGKSGGPRRNDMLVELAGVYHRHGYTVVVEAFPGPQSRGTWDLVNKAKAAGFEINVTRMPA